MSEEQQLMVAMRTKVFHQCGTEKHDKCPGTFDTQLATYICSCKCHHAGDTSEVRPDGRV